MYITYSVVLVSGALEVYYLLFCLTVMHISIDLIGLRDVTLLP